ncbi:hypothetical protein Lal_00041908 [Lupinus albus]|uniref:Putative glucan 1,4-alpha-glucosidase n=1 Tax=Lupinus albus TaxID=3870 RepID=A0A6A4QXR6_LUPAL|nr:putative glucan 1,4-alpha-glucosidase [Lupinus albus]KAF1895627.1 hypothetical protein Lal_00041908 [Lupinus albus]
MMEALASSCSKAIVKSLGSYFPRGGAAFVSDRPKICFSSNEKKGCNFQFLKLVQNKGIYPIHAVKSETESMLQLDLDTEKLEALQTNELKTIHVKFQLQKDCAFGEQFLLVGDDPMFGSWNPSNALPMTWSDGHVWTTHLNIPAGKAIQFKFILKGKTGDIIWQPGPDRILHTWEAMTRITVCEDWENAEAQKLIQEYQHDYSNEVESNAELIQTHAKEQIISLEEIIKNVDHIMTERKMMQQNEESSKSSENDDKIEALRHNRKAAPVKKQKKS